MLKVLRVSEVTAACHSQIARLFEMEKRVNMSLKNHVAAKVHGADEHCQIEHSTEKLLGMIAAQKRVLAALNSHYYDAILPWCILPLDFWLGCVVTCESLDNVVILDIPAPAPEAPTDTPAEPN